VRVELPEGNWAEIRPVEELSRADRRAVNKFVVYEVNAEAGRMVINAGADDDAATALLERICTDWSLPLPPPSKDVKSLDRLSLAVDDALRAAIRPHTQAILGHNAPTKDNEVPTAASAS
jgi:hypothetical protein